MAKLAYEMHELEYGIKHAEMILQNINADRVSRNGDCVNKVWKISYVEMDGTTIKQFSDWDQRRLGLMTGGEYLIVVDITDTEKPHILYAINVSGDSVLECMHQLFDLLSAKF